MQCRDVQWCCARTDILLFPYFLSELLIKLLQTVILSVKVTALSSPPTARPGDTDGHLTCSIIVPCRAGRDNTADITSSSTYFAEIRAVTVRSVSIIRVRSSCPYSSPSVRTLSIVIRNKTPICQAVCLSDPGPPASLLSHKDS